MGFGSSNSGSAAQQAVDRFAEMMIERMEAMRSTGWQKNWIGGSSEFAGLPQNVGGRNYSGSNAFFLHLYSAAKGYQLPVFLTFKQAQNLKAHVLKGERAFPVVYWDILVHDRNGQKVGAEEYRAMSAEERKGMDVIPFFKSFPVYNIEQTNLAEVQPERVQKLKERFKQPELRDTEGMYVHGALDRLVAKQEWICPILADKQVDGAFYSPREDRIVLPMKAQFNIGNSPEEVYRGGMEYYSTMLHEMSHSTMTPERLNRDMGGRFGDPKYAKEELVAELTAAMISHSMGFDSKVTDNSAAYLDGWIAALKQEPKFIVSVMADVNRASEMILDSIDRQRLILNETPYLTKNNPLIAQESTERSFQNAAIVKMRSGEYGIRASYEGIEMGLKKVEKEVAKTFFQLTDVKDKLDFLQRTAEITFEPEVAQLKRSQQAQSKLSW